MNWENTLDCITSFLNTLGYQKCGLDQSLENGWHKIAIYEGPNGPEHLARQSSNGLWSSKMSNGIDIEHDSLNVLEGGILGVVVCIMKRAWNGNPPVLPPLVPATPLLITPSGMPLL